MNIGSTINRIRGKRTLRILDFIRSKLLVGRVMKTIDLDAFKNFQEIYKDADPLPHGYSKYLDIFPWMSDKLMHVLHLKLDKSRPLKILDIGTGTGYFPYICKFYGHDVVALDLDSVPMYNDFCKFLKIDRRTWRVEKFVKLPDLGQRFDLVTAFMIKFNNHYRADLWSTEEWKFLIDDLRANHLTPNGRIFLDFNANLDGSFYDVGLRSYFNSLGAIIWHNEVDINGPVPNAVISALDQLLGVESPNIQPKRQ